MNIKNPKYQIRQDKRSIAGTFFINLVNKNTVNVAQIVEKIFITAWFENFQSVKIIPIDVHIEAW